MTQLHFTIGPVQRFVAKSRRTRDLWASSYLLSFLSGQAMLGALDEATTTSLSLPHVDAARIAGLLARDNASLPNRFTLEVANVDEGRAAARGAVERFYRAWRTVADSVFEQFLAPVATDQCKRVWARQVEHFWELAWIVSDAPAPLARRKTWRTPSVTEEGGDHCTMMGDLAELSGFERTHQRREQDAFWAAVRRNSGDLDLRDDERLSAIAFIKRFFPKIGTKSRRFEVQSWPSTAYVAAAPWLKRVHASGPIAAEQARAYSEQVRDSAPSSLGERHQRLHSLRTLGGTGDFPRLDGNFFYRETLENEKRTPLRASANRGALIGSLASLHRAVGTAPAPYYAMLLMDGDSMGELMGAARAAGSLEAASSALVDFADSVPEVVAAHDGVAIYAGGDDVLAMLPVPTAIACAAALAGNYSDRFERVLPASFAHRATLSGALVFAHYRAAFSTILGYAHALLDDVAKDATGRDSLAVALYKASGLALQWAAPWEHIVRGDETVFEQLDVARFSSSYLYNIRTRVGLLTDKDLPAPGEHGRLFDGFDPRRVLVADFLASEDRERDEDPADVERLIGDLMALCAPAVRRDGKLQVQREMFGVDGAMLARFLADEGLETL